MVHLAPSGLFVNTNPWGVKGEEEEAEDSRVLHGLLYSGRPWTYKERTMGWKWRLPLGNGRQIPTSRKCDNLPYRCR